MGIIKNLTERFIGIRDDIAGMLKDEDLSSRLIIKKAKSDCVLFEKNIIEIIKQIKILESKITSNLEDIVKFEKQIDKAVTAKNEGDVRILLTNIELAKRDNEYMQEEINKNVSFRIKLEGQLVKLKSKISVAYIKYKQDSTKLNCSKIRKRMFDSMNFDSSALDSVVGLAEKARDSECEVEAYEEYVGEDLDEKYDMDGINVEEKLKEIMKGA